MKLDIDGKFVKLFRNEQLAPTSASGNYKLKQKVATLLVDSVLKKQLEKQKLKKDVIKICVSLIVLNTLFHQINIKLKRKFKKIGK